MDDEEHQDSPEATMGTLRRDTPLPLPVEDPPESSTAATPTTGLGSATDDYDPDNPGNGLDNSDNFGDDEDLPSALQSMSQSLRNSQATRQPFQSQDELPDSRPESIIDASETDAEPEDPPNFSAHDVSDSGSLYEPSQEKGRSGRKKPATRAQTRGQQINSGEKESSEAERKGSSARRLYESRAAQKASEQSGSAGTKQKTQKKSVVRGRIAKQPFTEDVDQTHNEQAPETANSGRASGAKTAKQKTASSDAQTHKKKATVASLPKHDNNDPYEIDEDISQQAPNESKTRQQKKPSRKSQGSRAGRAQQNPVPKKASRRKQNSRLKEQQEQEVFAIDDIEDSTADDVQTHLTRNAGSTKLKDRMQLDDESAVATKKQKILEVDDHQTHPTNHDHAGEQDLTKPKQSMIKKVSTKQNGIEVASAKAQQDVVHSNGHSGVTQHMSRVRVSDGSVNDALSEPDFTGVGLEGNTPSDSDDHHYIDEQLLPPAMPDPEHERSMPAKKKLPFRKRGEPRQTNSSSLLEDTPSHKVGVQSNGSRKRDSIHDEELHARESKKARKSAIPKVSMHYGKEAPAINHKVPQTEDDCDIIPASEVNMEDQVTHQEPKMVSGVLPNKTTVAARNMSLPAARSISEATIIEERVIEQHKNNPQRVAADNRQDKSNSQHDLDKRNVTISGGSSSSTANSLPAEMPARQKGYDFADASESSRSFHSVLHQAAVDENADPRPVPRPALNRDHPMTNQSPATDHRVPGQYDYSQPIPSGGKQEAPLLHQDTYHSQQRGISARDMSDHSHFQSSNVVSTASRFKRGEPLQVRDFAFKDMLSPRRHEPRERASSSLDHLHVGVSARPAARQALKKHVKPRVLDHDDVFSPGTDSREQNTSVFVDELKRKTEAQNHAEAVLRHNEKTHEFSEELLRAPRRHESNETHILSNIETTDRHRGQRGAVRPFIYPKAALFNRELVENDKHRTSKSRIRTIGVEYPDVQGSHPYNQPAGAFRQDTGASLPRRMYNGHSSEGYHEDRANLEASSTEKQDQGSSETEGGTEVDRAASDLVDTIHAVTTAIIGKLYSQDGKLNNIVEEYNHNGRRIVAQLHERQQEDLRQVSRVFQNDCREISSAYKNTLKGIKELRNKVSAKRKFVNEVEAAKRARYEHVERSISAAMEELGKL
ncbi:hypothetical protein PFICI_01931 [Pestalotiopsis fici W106-1]|uniref:Uncharacterized protein n=1 Tax=Pestalotiopsis fici (strain W106-1 / CGMCC3.15140) TaxID=1229662 RepID=W3XPX2_PESFW|nr:uncharacterized protein PFICI_01931 [Pestalotiopsis fici W106-1]ETS88103.1 hypothetical protein PFICI_01931 [Pestalotiopsis fici W106-1]